MDNEANIEINYYKASNGEGYFMLPRKYPAGVINADADYKTPQDIWDKYDYLKDNGGTVDKGKNSGICWYEPYLRDFLFLYHQQLHDNHFY